MKVISSNNNVCFGARRVDMKRMAGVRRETAVKIGKQLHTVGKDTHVVDCTLGQELAYGTVWHKGHGRMFETRGPKALQQIVEAAREAASKLK